MSAARVREVTESTPPDSCCTWAELADRSQGHREWIYRRYANRGLLLELMKSKRLGLAVLGPPATWQQGCMFAKLLRRK